MNGWIERWMGEWMDGLKDGLEHVIIIEHRNS